MPSDTYVTLPKLARKKHGNGNIQHGMESHVDVTIRVNQRHDRGVKIAKIRTAAGIRPQVG